jgi:DNA-binding LacI/PurR family transcriptional regulator
MTFARQVDIARKIKVSQRAVAAVLGSGNANSNVRVGEKLRHRILKVAASMNYRAHAYAQLMRTGKSRLIAIVHQGLLASSQAERLSSAAQAIHQAGYKPVIHNILWHSGTAAKVGFTSVYQEVVDQRAEGVLLLAPSALMPSEFVQSLKKVNIPVVSIGGIEIPKVSQVRVDARQGMRLLTEHLLTLGHKRLTLVCGLAKEHQTHRAAWPTLERVYGFEQALAAQGQAVSLPTPLRRLMRRSMTRSQGMAKVLLVEDATLLTDRFELGLKAMRQLLTLEERPEAVLLSNDYMAFGALTACREMRVSVPAEIALTGFDDDIVSRYGYVRITTIRQDTVTIAQRAVEILFDAIGGKPGPTTLESIPCELVVRDSCAAVFKNKSKA